MSLSNTFGLPFVSFSGSNGDVSSVSGLLRVSGAIGLTRATYADNNYLALRKQGLLAYKTLDEAIASWRVSGEAQLLFGTPTVTNQATIHVGEGQVLVISGGHPQNQKADVDVEYTNIIGKGIDATILTHTGDYTANQPGLRFSIASGSIQNLTINTDNAADPTSFSNGGFDIQTASQSVLLVDRVKFYGRGTSYNVAAISNGIPFYGIIRNCIFDNHCITTSQISFGNSFNGILENSTFNVRPSVISAVSFSNTTHGGNISNCTFSGVPDVALITLVDSNYIGEIDNCYFRSDTSGVLAIKASEFAAGNPARFLVTDSTFEMQGPCLSGQLGINARIVNCYMRTEQGNQHCVMLQNDSFGNPGIVTILGSRLIGNGTGLAVFSMHSGGAVSANCLIAGSYLRMPNGDVPSSSISSNITNVALSPCNVETPSSITI